MDRIVLFVLLSVSVNIVLSLQVPENFQYESDKASSRKYYPSDSLNLVTLGVVNGKKYFFSNHRATWYEASYFCNAHGMDLASIETQHENSLIMEQVLKIGLAGNRLWISGHRIGRSTWLWINGDFILFTDWETDQPNDQKNEHCLHIVNSKWHDDKCINAWLDGGFICEERETVIENESDQRSTYHDDFFNMVSLDNTTEKQYLFTETPADWFEASYFCNAYGMDLVTIETEYENELIFNYIENIGMTQSKEYWTSAHEIGRTTWHWINGENLNFTDWATDEPNEQYEERCMYIYLGNWYNRLCYVSTSIKIAFICESRDMPLSNATNNTNYYPTDILNLVTLGPGNGTKYLFAYQLTSWFEASYFCNAHGMDLVTMETEMENAVLTNHSATLGSTNLFWTSGHKIGRATYLWINGVFLTYNDWAPGEPMDYANDCMTLLSDGWYDSDCFFYVYFICEERIVPPEIPEDPVVNTASAAKVIAFLAQFCVLLSNLW